MTIPNIAAPVNSGIASITVDSNAPASTVLSNLISHYRIYPSDDRPSSESSVNRQK